MEATPIGQVLFAASDLARSHEPRPSVSQETRDRIEEIKRKNSEVAERAPERASETAGPPKRLPVMKDWMRTMPNHIARSSLFAPVARGSDRTHIDVVLVSRQDAVIKFWGQQLDETHADVWMQVLHEASKYPLGESVSIKRAELLRALGRHCGGTEYDWLAKSMKALTFAMLVIEVTKQGRPKLKIGTRQEALHLINAYEFDEENEVYTIRLDSRWQQMFGNREYALINWEKRLRFRRHQDMAKALQRLIATSNERVQRYPLEWLKAKLDYRSPMNKFRDALGAAMKELERLQIISDGKIELNTKGAQQASWTRS
jgi:hypothetical protein